MGEKMIFQYIEIITDFQAIHNWPECNIEEVKYLRNPHRHKIILTVQIETSKDRQIEFFMLKDEVDDIINNLYGNSKTKNLGRKSMEEICSDVLYALQEKYKNIAISIKASEDGQVAGGITYTPDEDTVKEIEKHKDLNDFM